MERSFYNPDSSGCNPPLPFQKVDRYADLWVRLYDFRMTSRLAGGHFERYNSSYEKMDRVLLCIGVGGVRGMGG